MPRHRPPLEVITGGRAAARAASPPLELAALGTGLVVTLVLMARMGSWSARLGSFQLLYALAFGFFALALAGHERQRHAPHAAFTVIAVAIAARLALLPVTPTLSDDIYRYVWEGKVAAHGADPYRQNPLDPALAPLRDRTIHPRINHPELATIYPPLSMAGFALVAKLWPTVWAMKLWIGLHDLALVAMLLAFARQRGTSPIAVVAYAWNPLVLVEYAGNGHNDPTAMLWLVAALMWAERRPWASALALAVGSLTKLAPLVALPFLARRWSWGARLLAAALIGVGLAWFWSATRGADSGLTAYWMVWRNNDLIFDYLVRWLGEPGRARAAAIAAVATVAVLAWFWRWESVRATRATLRTGLLVSPVAHPWYFGWAAVLEPVRPSPPWLLLSLTVILSYGVLTPPLAGSSYHLPLGWRWIEYGLPLTLAIGLALHERRVPRTR